MYKPTCLRIAGIYSSMLLSTSVFAADACNEPVFTDDIPDGKTATQEEIDYIYNAVNDFVKEGEAYIECIDDNEPRAIAERKRNAMLDEMESLAAKFNRQLRYFRRANS